MDWLHRVFTGQTVSSTELRVGGFLVFLWFLMDLVQGSTGRTGNFPAPAHKINFRLTHYPLS